MEFLNVNSEYLRLSGANSTDNFNSQEFRDIRNRFHALMDELRIRRDDAINSEFQEPKV